MSYVVLFKTVKKPKWRLAVNKIFKTFNAADKFASSTGSVKAIKAKNVTIKVKKIKV